jgi:organic hydroperoxide reductase OsmC/OhrA
MTSRHTARVVWTRDDAPFTDLRYPRAHRWHFDGGAEVRASSSPHSVRVPLSDPAAVDPEEAFVASLSSCHMLWFLALAAKRGFVVERYDDNAGGTLAPDAAGRKAMTTVVLRPAITWAGQAPDAETIAALHEAAHHECYIANSVTTRIVVEPAEPA